MAVIKRGILGGFSGRVANVVGSSWKGIAVMKSLPLSVANPNTAAQQQVRSNLSQISKDASAILTEIIKPLWDRFAQQESGYNAYVSANIGEYLSGEITTPENIRASIGSLTDAAIDSMSSNEGTNDVVIGWTDNSGIGNALATDEVYVTIFNQDQIVWEGFITGDVRSDGTTTVVLANQMIVADVMYAYLSFSRPDGTIVSTSTNASAAAA